MFHRVQMFALVSTVLLTSMQLLGQDPSFVNTTINYTANRITVSGNNFSPGGHVPHVVFNGSTLTVISFTNQRVVATLPSGLLPGTYTLVVTNSLGGSESFDVAFGAQGPQGPIGPIGPQGPAGAAGPAGPAGATGAPGPRGATGSAGPAGATGAQGPQGPAGAVGPAGATGPQGAKGDTGAIGATGPQGSQGPAGKDGAAGAQGPAGAAGPAGATGPQGPKGDTGATGATGAQGPQGPAGKDGAPGAQGPAGKDGANGAPGAQGPAGPAGPQGPTGSQGPTGPPGPADTTFSNKFGTGSTIGPLNANGAASCVLGEVRLFVFSTNGNFLPADGTLLDPNGTYSTLYQLIGTTFGGDGNTTFALPDLRPVTPNGLKYAICVLGIFP